MTAPMHEEQHYYRELVREHSRLMRQRRANAAAFRELAEEQTQILTGLKSGPDYTFAYALRELYLQAEQAALQAADAHEAHALDYAGAVLT